MPEDNLLCEVVELNERSKALSSEAHHISLRALDAVVRSQRASPALRGFVEVSSQMREWSRTFESEVKRVFALAGSQVEVVSQIVRQQRVVGLLTKAAERVPRDACLGVARQRADAELSQAHTQLKTLRRSTLSEMQDLQQLGLMATVLSRVALIEAASGTEDERRDLGVVTADFAARSESVASAITTMIPRLAEHKP